MMLRSITQDRSIKWVLLTKTRLDTLMPTSSRTLFLPRRKGVINQISSMRFKVADDLKVSELIKVLAGGYGYKFSTVKTTI